MGETRRKWTFFLAGYLLTQPLFGVTQHVGRVTEQVEPWTLPSACPAPTTTALLLWANSALASVGSLSWGYGSHTPCPSASQLWLCLALSGGFSSPRTLSLSLSPAQLWEQDLPFLCHRLPAVSCHVQTTSSRGKNCHLRSICESASC